MPSARASVRPRPAARPSPRALLAVTLLLLDAGCGAPFGSRRTIPAAPDYEPRVDRSAEEIVAEFGAELGARRRPAPPRDERAARGADERTAPRAEPAQSWLPQTGPDAPLPTVLVPPWTRSLPRDVVEFAPPALSSPEARGAVLANAMNGLRPGQMLRIGGGTYSLPGAFTLDVRGTAEQPIVITSAGGGVILTHRDGSQNVMNIGRAGGPAVRFVVLAGLEITGGSQGLRIISADNLWIDGCRIHDTGDAGITANTQDTDRLTITRNEIWATNGTGEGMYLGANNAEAVMSRSVVALNHVHDTGGRQGDGIEVKQGSWGNQIVANHVHDTPYPAILVYGTGGNERNVIERNVCYRSGDNVMQVQGEALVANNLIVASTNPGGAAFQSHDHQGQVRDLELVNNTIVNAGVAARFSDWAGRPGLVLVNNAFYAQSDAALLFLNGAGDVTLRGNVVVGPVQGVPPGEGLVTGKGLEDFTSLTWDGVEHDARPSPESALVGAAAADALPGTDLSGRPRGTTPVAGCLEVR